MNHNITMESFGYLLKEKLEEELGNQCKVVTQEVTKNNGVNLQGIMISHEKSNVSPTIYINHFYEEYQNNIISLEDSVAQIIEIYHHHKVDCHVDMESFTCFEQAKEKIYYKLINTEANQELLRDIPHKQFFDLSIIYVYEVNNERMGNASIVIRNNHLDLWKITPEELHEVAETNTPKIHPYHIESLQKVMQEICMEQRKHLSQEGIESEEMDMLDMIMNMKDDSGMYVLSNRTKMFGASCMLYKNLLKDFAAATEKNFMILPSSIHEVLLLPVEDSLEAPHFKECVMDVNRTQLEEEDILSDSVYYYDMKLDNLTKIA